MTLTEFQKQIHRITAATASDGLEKYHALVASGKVIETHSTTDKRRKIAIDTRTFRVGEEYHIYPIANVSHSWYIICPYCGEIHTHGNISGGYKSKKLIRHTKEEQCIFKDTHPSIIDRDTFERAAELLSHKRRIRPFDDMPLFHDKVFCADCGSRMHLMRTNDYKDT